MGKGFTLLELMIVIAIISIIALIAIPGLLHSRISANEGAGLGTLRTVCTAQGQFKSQALVDQDNNGNGEYGIMGELTGTVNIRTKGVKANPVFVSEALAPRTNLDFGKKSGYYCRIYLPGASAVVSDNALTSLAANPNDAGYQEGKWRAYLWPTSAGYSGIKALAIDQTGEIYATANRDTATGGYVWSGNTDYPAYNAAINATLTENANFRYNIMSGVGSENQNWLPCK